MHRLTWIGKAALAVAAAAVGIAAVVAGIVPHLVDILRAHDQVPVELPGFASLARETNVYDSTGAQIARFRLEHIQEVTLEEVPEDVVAAVLAVEDKVYWRHKGVNLRSLVRAVLSNVSSGSAGQGASTITQQVVKNEFLGGFARDGRYKVLQARYATLLEKKITKKEILERYLNTIYFGNNAYGISAAAEAYFGKPVQRLTLVEGAFLAGMIRSPIGYDPIRRPERSRARFKVVMERLADEQLLDVAQAEDLGENWQIPEILRSRPGEAFSPTYFSAAVRDFLLQDSDLLGDTVQERYNNLYRGGLSIYTTLDPRLQRAAEDARLKKLPANAGGFDTAVVSLDSKTGAVRAMVGGGGFRPGQSEINMALRPRQTGSSIKIFILAAAVQAGAVGSDIIDGRRGCVLPNPGNPKEPFVIKSGVAGKVGPLKEATWASLNCAFARLSQIVGLNRVVDTTRRMGVTSRLDAYASFATGANEVSPMDMASGAQTLANEGVHHDPYYVERIVRTATGDVLYQHEDPGTAALSVDAARRTTSILTGVLKRGTAARTGWLSGGKRPAAGKTGTQQNNTNAWFVGYTPQYVTAVWVGNPKGYVPMVNIPEFVKVGVRTVQGSSFPARIWKAFMDVAHEGLPIVEFAAPPPDGRDAMLLYLPGTDCLAQNVTPDAGSGTTVLQTVPSGTGVPADVVDPLWPLPMAPADAVVYPCSTDGSATTTTVAVSTSVQVDETLPPGTDAPGTTASGDSTTTALPGPGRGRARRG
ncbi:MAG: hypothetical protein F2934_05180 [Actinobacteria bacterium]|uniref:peptidoglycan glycosyltransferase n=2 Tax=freshwater metagenome TaxID=449393 RepID=A0A6J7U6D2_9ZZZZ|nr:hypothetical protein [Actinomycetota bacterium]MSY12889.1 hypothetical protein [Actinomycetota bacterium]MTB06509.1 hypothetical protein [Actinomycetota bacterium]